MGRFADGLSARRRARRVAADIHHPDGYRGMVMWCSRCRAEIMRSKARRRVSMAQQQAAVDAHDLVCKVPHLVSETRQRVTRRPPVLLGAVLCAIVAAALAYLVLR